MSLTVTEIAVGGTVHVRESVVGQGKAWDVG
jgi:hypothetical protein